MVLGEEGTERVGSEKRGKRGWGDGHPAQVASGPCGGRRGPEPSPRQPQSAPSLSQDVVPVGETSVK